MVSHPCKYDEVVDGALHFIERRYDFRRLEQLRQCLDREIRYANGPGLPSCERLLHLSVCLVERDVIVDRHWVTIPVDKVVLVVVYSMCTQNAGQI